MRLLSFSCICSFRLENTWCRVYEIPLQRFTFLQDLSTLAVHLNVLVACCSPQSIHCIHSMARISFPNAAEYSPANVFVSPVAKPTLHQTKPTRTDWCVVYLKRRCFGYQSALRSRQLSNVSSDRSADHYWRMETARARASGERYVWLGGRDSNPDSQIQSLKRAVSLRSVPSRLVLIP